MIEVDDCADCKKQFPVEELNPIDPDDPNSESVCFDCDTERRR